MTTALSVARENALYEAGAIFLGTTTSAGAAGGTTVVSTALYRFADDEINNWWVLVTSGTYAGQSREITDFVSSTGTITVTQAFGGQIATSVTFEVMPFDPADVERALNKALYDSYDYIVVRLNNQTLSTREGQLEYSIPSTFREAPARVYMEVPYGLTGEEQLLLNPDFETWTSSTVPGSWGTATGLTLSQVTEDTGEVKYGTYACKAIVTLNTAASLPQTISNPAYYAGQELTFGVWVFCETASRVKVKIADDSANTSSTDYHGGSGWELIKVTHAVNSAPSSLTVSVTIASGDAITIYLDNGWLVRGKKVPEYDWAEVGFTYDPANSAIRLNSAPLNPRQLKLEGAGYPTQWTAGTDTSTTEVNEPQIRIVYALALQSLFEMRASKRQGEAKEQALRNMQLWAAEAASRKVRFRNTKVANRIPMPRWVNG